MPIYEFVCVCGEKAELLRKISQRNRKATCPKCSTVMSRIVSRPHVEPDGIYSYCPNIGSEADFERKRSAIKNGVRVQPKA